MSNVLAGPAFGQLAVRHRLTLVVAGAGWGKSASLRGLAATAPCIEVRQPPTGWTPFALAHALVDGVAEHTTQAPAVDLPAYPTADSPDRRDQFAALATSVCTAATAITHDTLALLDDIDVGDDDSLVFLEQLVLGVPPRLHLVVACRTQPNLRIARLRAAGEVARIGTEELAVRPDDIDRFGLDPAARAAVLDIVVATGGWPLAVHLAVETSRRGGPLDRGALIEHLLSPDAILFDYLAEEVLANLSDPERDLLVLAARVPELSADLLDDIGCGDLAVHLARLTAQRIFLEPVPGRADHVRSTEIGATFLRRALPPPSPQTIDAAICGMLRAGDAENALVLSAGFGDPKRAREVLLAIEHPDWLTAPDALEAALAVAEQGGPHHRLTELRGNLAYQRGEWDEALRLYLEASDQHGVPTTARARKRAGLLYLRGRLDEADEVCAAVKLDGSDPAEEARVLAWRAVICWARGDADACADSSSRRWSRPDAAPTTERSLRPTRHGRCSPPCTATSRPMPASTTSPSATPNDPATSPRSCASAPTSGAASTSKVSTARPSRSSTWQSRRRSWPARTRSRRSPTTTVARPISPSVNSTSPSPICAGPTRSGRGWSPTASSTRSPTWDSCSSCAVSAARRSPCSTRPSASPPTCATPRASHRRTPGWPTPSIATTRMPPPRRRARQSRPTTRCGCLTPTSPPAGSRSIPTICTAASEWAAKATALARQRHDRPALAEALLLSANLDTSESASLAQQASRLWHDLGSPIGEARANLVLARSTTGRQRDELVAGAERMLQDTGAWGALADARRELGEGVTSSVVITTLGGFRVIRDGEPVDVGEWGSRKARDLVKLLVARRGAPVVRDEVTDLLWPDEPDRSARRLSVLLSTVRTVFDPRKTRSPDYFVAADHDTVWLVRDHVDIDVEHFLVEAADGRRMLAAGDRRMARTLLADAAARYLGVFCADDPYADWAAGLRELAKHTFVDTCFELARLADEMQEYSEAIRYWLRSLDVDPYDEDAHLGLVNSLRSQRRHGEARRAYRHYSAKMLELDVEPAPYPT